MQVIIALTVGLVLLVPLVSAGSRVVQGPQRFPGLTKVSQIQPLQGVAGFTYKDAEEACLELHGTIPLEPNQCDTKYLSGKRRCCMCGRRMAVQENQGFRAETNVKLHI